MSDEFEKKSGKKIGIIIAIVAVLVVAAVAGILYINSRKQPDKIFESAIQDAFKMTEKADEKSGKFELEVSASIDGNDAQVKMINTILSQIKLKMSAEVDLNKKIFNSNLVALYGQDEVINVSSIIQNEEMYFYLKDIFSKYIKVDTELLEQENIDLSAIFETGDISSKDLTKDIETILIKKITSKDMVQEKVELNGEKVQKTTVKLTAKDVAEIVKDVLNKINEYKKTEEIEDLIEDLESEIEYIEDEDVYVEISIYTKGLANNKIKTEINIVEKDAMVIVIDVEEKDKNEKVVTLLVNEMDSNVSKAEKIAEIDIKEDNDNSGTMELKTEIEGIEVKLNIKYSMDYKAKIEAKDVSNSISVEDLSEEDQIEMMENIQNNPYLSSLIELFEEEMTPSVYNF